MASERPKVLVVVAGGVAHIAHTSVGMGEPETHIIDWDDVMDFVENPSMGKGLGYEEPPEWVSEVYRTKWPKLYDELQIAIHGKRSCYGSITKMSAKSS